MKLFSYKGYYVPECPVCHGQPHFEHDGLLDPQYASVRFYCCGVNEEAARKNLGDAYETWRRARLKYIEAHPESEEE